MIINHNLMALNTHRQLSINNSASQKSLEKLSSGYRINRAGDDAAGLAISEKMRGQIRGLNQASRNALDGISLIQTAEGALNETQAILQRMRELAVQSANDTNVDADRQSIQDEINQLAREITRIAETTEFNTQKLLNGTLKDIAFHIGANQGQNITLSINNMDAYALRVTQAVVSTGNFSQVTLENLTTTAISVKFITSGGSTPVIVAATSTTLTINVKVGTGAATATAQQIVDLINNDADASKYVIASVRNQATAAMSAVASTELSATTYTPADSKNGLGISVSTQANADKAITVINNAINMVSAERSKLGAIQNRLEHTIKNLDTSSENLQASESRIRDVDMAKEMMEFTKNSILSQASQAMLAQANLQPQSVLQLLQ
jgi:flagellin